MTSMSSAKSTDAGATSLDDFAVTFPAQVEDEFSAAYGAAHWEQIKRALAKPYVARHPRTAAAS